MDFGVLYTVWIVCNLQLPPCCNLRFLLQQEERNTVGPFQIFEATLALLFSEKIVGSIRRV